MPRRPALTAKQSDDLLRHVEQIRRIAEQPAGPMRATSSCTSFLFMGHAELAHEVRGQVDAVIALGRQQHPRKSGPTPALRAQRRRLLAALAAKVRLGKGERQVVRGRGAAVRWSDGTLRNRLMDYLQGKTVSGT